MKNKVIMLASVAIAVLVLAFLGWTYLGGSDDSEVSEADSAQSISDANEFNISAFDGSYKITFSSIDNNGVKSTGEVLFESATKYKVTTDAEGQNDAEIIVNGNDVYFSEDGDSFNKFSIEQFGANSSALGITEQYSYNGSLLASVAQEGVTYIGQQPCAAGTCEVYSYTDGEGTTTTAKIETNTNRPSEIYSEAADGTTTTILFDYDEDLEVSIPDVADIIEIPDFDLPEGIEIPN